MKSYNLIYVDNLPEGAGGRVSYPLFMLPEITILNKYKDDMGILNHEICHTKQFWRTLGFHVILREFKWYRQRCEISCYKEQLCWPPAITALAYYRRMYAGFIATKYGLDITEDEAYRRLG